LSCAKTKIGFSEMLSVLKVEGSSNKKKRQDKVTHLKAKSRLTTEDLTKFSEKCFL
jgi:hypothetical protein